MPRCFFAKLSSTARMTLWVAILGASLSAASPTAVWSSTVRIDPRSGRLVRSVVLHPRAVVGKTISPVSVSRMGRRAENAPSSDTRAWKDHRVAFREQLRRLAAETAKRHAVDPDLVEAVIQVESNYNPAAVSPKGAIGLMQLIPATARRFGVQNPFDPRENLEGGIQYLKYLQQLYGDDRLALAAYNAGEGAVDRYGWIPPYPETQTYVYEVGRRYGSMRRQRSRNAAWLAPTRRLVESWDPEGRLHIRYEPQP